MTKEERKTKMFKAIDLWADGMKMVVQAVVDFMKLVVDMWTD